MVFSIFYIASGTQFNHLLEARKNEVKHSAEIKESITTKRSNFEKHNHRIHGVVFFSKEIKNTGIQRQKTKVFSNICFLFPRSELRVLETLL
jgi:hypothetical protein